MLESIAEWTMNLFLPLGAIGLFIVSFAESSFFPIPPEVLLLPLCLAHPERGLFYGGIVSVASVLGGVAGYFIGEKGGRPLLLKLTSETKLNHVERLFSQYDAWAIGVAALTPLPYKLFTIGAGIFKINLRRFVVASIIGRGARFFGEGLLFQLYGPQIMSFITGNFELITIGITLVFTLFYLARRKRLF